MLVSSLYSNGLSTRKIRRSLERAGITRMTIFGEEKLQRCTVHTTENILKECPKNVQEELKAKLHRLWNSTTRLAAEEFLKEICVDYSAKAPKAIAWLVEDKEHLFRYFAFPRKHTF
ncbi:MAG: transposase [Spirochaetota bacterium]|nr:transposase [Spirochaetota bacterium]